MTLLTHEPISNFLFSPIAAVDSLEAFNSALDANNLVAAYFYADWCPPCKSATIKFEMYAAKFPGAVFIKINAGAQPEIKQSLHIKGYPTFRFYKDGKVIHELLGLNPEALDKKVREFCKLAKKCNS